MKHRITITEILGRAEQGMTRPFVCRGNDWLTYSSKGPTQGGGPCAVSGWRIVW
jgi:hypothetical protein